MKQFLLYLTKIAVPVKTKFLVSIFLLGFGSVFAQNGIIGSGFGTNDWTTTNIFSAGAGNSRIFTATPNGTGNQYFRLVRNSGGIDTQFGPFGCVDTDWTNPGVAYGMSVCSNGAFFINCPNTTDNYVFKTPNEGTAMDFLYFRVQGAVRSVTAVEQLPLATNVNECHGTTVTATLDGTLAVGQGVYLRYTKDEYTTSTVVPLAGSGTTYAGKIPSAFNTAGATVSYYVFTSGITTPSGADADLYTINLNNNGGPNYSYVVASGGATTSIPDPNFEQALIDLDLDCDIDGQVFTSNISDVTILDIRQKGILSLVGIEGFTSLEELYCNNEEDSTPNDNAITTLDVSSFPNLIRLYCQNNLITDLNISGLTKLEALDTSNNPFIDTTLDVHLNPNLYYLVCQNNGLTDLNISGLTNLQTLIVWYNQLTLIDVSDNLDLTYLDCDDNGFTSLDVSALKNLNQFYCSGNQLTSLDVRGLNNLSSFYCSNNPLTCILVDDVNAAIVASTTIDLELGAPYTYWEKDSGVFYSYCACDLPSTTWNGTSWNNGAPISTQAAIIAGDYSEAANITACTLTVENGATVTIPSGFNVTLNAPLSVEAGSSFTLSNNANLIQSTNTANTGNVVVNRNSNSLYRQDYTMWSSPVASQNLLAFSPLTTITPESRFYTYDSATDLYSSIVNPSATVFAKGAGYLIRMPNTNPTSGYDAGTTSIAYPGIFTGVPTTGNVTLAVTNGTYNAIGNPYPSTISTDAFITENAITEALYFWRKSNNVNQATAPTTSYATYTFAGGTGTSPSGGITPNGTIQVGQGFIAKSTSTTLKFTNAMRTANNSNQILRTKAVERNRIWLNLTNPAGAFSQMMVAYMTDATQDIDAAIDGRYFDDSQTALNSLISSEEFAIQGRALPFDGTDIVPLAFKTNLAGDYTIAIDHVDGLFSGSQDVFLKDNNTGTETNLKAGAYTFTAASGVDNARFSLKYQKTLGVNDTVFNDESVTIHKNKGTLYVNSGAITINNIKVFDIQGRLIAEQKNVKSNSATIKDLKATQQVLIVKITSQDNKVVSKKVVN